MVQTLKLSRGEIIQTQLVTAADLDHLIDEMLVLSQSVRALADKIGFLDPVAVKANRMDKYKPTA